MNADFIPGDSRTLMLEPGTRVMLFKEEDIWLAMAVDTIHCVHGRTMEELEENWGLSGEAYKMLREEMGKEWWEPPKPFEYESVWEAGTPVEFTHNANARFVDANLYKSADESYQERYNLLVRDISPSHEDEKVTEV